MGEEAAEGLMHRRIEFHAPTEPSAAARAVPVPVPGGFSMEGGLFTGVAAAQSGREASRFENGESSGSGFDPEPSAPRIYPRRIGAGLYNVGNSCYLNSVLQCLTYTQPFVAYLQSGKHKSSCRTAGFCALCALQNHVRDVLQSTGKILTPHLFVDNIKCISRSFRYYRQEDAHELMVSLLESMHKCCLPSGIPSESPNAYEKSLVHRIFGGRLRSQVRCTRCSHCSNKFDPFLDLSLEIGNATTLTEALYNFTEEDLLDGGEKHYNCQQCKQKVVAKKRFIIDKAPSVLTIHLKRFNPFNPLQKIDKMVYFQTTLNLKPFVSDSEDMDLKYSLYGVLVHVGCNTQSGHYYCFVRTSSGLWHNLDDNEVCQVHEADVLRQEAYMLFYVRDRVGSSVAHEDNDAASLLETKMLSKKIACMNGAIRNGFLEKTLDFPPITKEDVKLQMHNPNDGQPSDISANSGDHCSNEDSNIEVIKASMSLNSELVQKAPRKLPDAADSLSTKAQQITPGFQRETMSPRQPDVCICDTKLQKLKPDNGQPSNVSATSRDQCSNEYGSTEVTKGSASQNNEPAQKATWAHLNGTTTLSTTTEQVAPASQRGTMSTGQPDGSIVGDACSDQKAHEKPLHDLPRESDCALNDLGKDILTSAFQLHSGVDGLLEANKQPNEPRTEACCKLTHDSDATTIAQVITAEDTAVSNEIISSKEDSTSGNEAKGLAMVTELSLKNTDDKRKAGEQTVVRNNLLGNAHLAMVKEVSVMEISRMADAEDQTSAQNNLLDAGNVDCEKKICSEDNEHVVSSEDCAQVMCPKKSVQVVDKDPCYGNLHKNMKLKSKKHVKYPVVNFYFGSKQLLLSSLKAHKKRKQKRTRRRSTAPMNAESIADDQQTSTSETVLTSGISCKSHRQKRSVKVASSEEAVQMYNKKQNRGDSCAAELTVDKKGNKDAALGTELASSCRSSVSNHDLGNLGARDEKGSWHFNLLTRGLRVPRWEDDDMPNTTAMELQCSSSMSIGYVLDEWHEAYDRGRRKKVRKSKRQFSGPNPFQEEENIRSRPRQRLQADMSGHQPLRI